MNILITTALNPTLDVVAGAYAHWKLRQFFHEEVKIGIAGKDDAPTQWLLKELKIEDVVRLEDSTEQFDVFVLWNAIRDKTALLLPPVVEVQRVIEIIDRGDRGANDYSAFPKAEITVEPVTFSTIATERYQGRRLTLDQTCSQLLYCAIYIATDNLSPERTSPRDRAALRYLQTKMDPPLTLVRDLFVATQPR